MNENTTPNTTYLPVEPLPQQVAPAPVQAPSSFPPSSPAVPEWEQHIPPPPIATMQPAQSIDGAAYREQMAREQFAPPQQMMLSQQQVAAPQQFTQTPFAPQSQPQPGQAYPVAVPPLRAPAPLTPSQSVPSSYGVQTPAYSPFRDDKNAYNLVVEHRGVSYFLNEMSPEVQNHADTFERRFIADPHHRVVDIAEGGPKIDRSIALEEVEGGEIEWFGQRITCAPGSIYERMPALRCYLVVRQLTVEEAGDELALLGRYPSTYKKLVAAKEVMYADVLEQCLIGWSIVGVEVNRANINRLALEVKRVCFTRLGAGSVMGLNEDDFFRSSRERTAGR